MAGWFPLGKPQGQTDVLLATLTLNNYSGSATPTESYFVFGQPFKKGDVPAGKVPQLRVSGAPIPAQFDLRSTWPDGSLRWCEISCVASSIAGAGTTTVKLWSVSGSYNNVDTHRTINDVNGTGGHDFKVVISNLTDFRGNVPAAGSTLTAGFNAATALGGVNFDPVKDLVKSGPVCSQWRAWMFFPGQQHLAYWGYVTAWTKQSDNSLATISHIAKVHNGFVNVSGATRFFYDAAYKDGASTIRSWGTGSAREKQFTWSGSNNELSFSTPHGYLDFQAVTVRNSGGSLPAGASQTFTADPTSDYITSATPFPRMGWMTSTGTLPAGLTANYPYSFFNGFGAYSAQCFPGDGASQSDLVNITDAGSGGAVHTLHSGLFDGVANPAIVYWVRYIDANTIRLTSDLNTSDIPITSAGVGNHFIVPRIFHQCHASWYTADTDGRSDWTGSEATIHVQHDQAHVISTRMIPPYDLAVTPASDIDQHAANGYFTQNQIYTPLDVQDLRSSVNSGGTHNTICPIPSWNAVAFLTQTEHWATRSRVNALVQPNYCGWISETNGKIPPLCGPSSFGMSGSFTGLATPDHLMAWLASGQGVVNCVDPDGSYGSWFPGSDGGTPIADWSHTPDTIHYTIVMEGGCHLIDSHIVYANGSLVQGPGDSGSYDWYGSKTRTKVANGRTYTGLAYVGHMRSEAWELRSIGYARATCPDNWVEAPYLDFLISNNAAYAADKINVEMPTSMKNMGWWEYTSYSYSNFMHHYLMRSTAFLAYLTENANAITWATYMAQLYKNAYAQTGTAACFSTLSFCGTTQDNALPNFWLQPADFSWFSYLGPNGSTPYANSFDPSPGASSFTIFYGGFGATMPALEVNMPLRFARSYGDNSRGNSILPGGFFYETTYYIASISGAEPNQIIQLSDTPGGPIHTYTTYTPNSGSQLVCFNFTSLVHQPNGIPSFGDNISVNNSAFTEALGCLAETVHYGISDVSAAYNAAYALAILNGTYSIPGIYQAAPNNPMWIMRPQ